MEWKQDAVQPTTEEDMTALLLHETLHDESADEPVFEDKALDEWINGAAQYIIPPAGGDMPASYMLNWRYIVAIRPCYQENGRNGTVVHYLDGHTEHYPSRCNVLVEHLAINFHTSSKVAKERAEAIMGSGCKRKPPLVLRQNLCFVQFKFREVYSKNDSTIGYVVAQFIKKVEELPNSCCRLFFHKGAPPLTVLQNKKSVYRQIRMAKIIQAQVDKEARFWENSNQVAAYRLSAEDWMPSIGSDEIMELVWEEELRRQQFEKRGEELHKRQRSEAKKDKKKT